MTTAELRRILKVAHERGCVVVIHPDGKIVIDPKQEQVSQADLVTP